MSTVIDHRTPSGSVRLAVSLLMTAVGWAAAYGVFATLELIVTHRITDTVPLLFWTGVFVLSGWLLAFVPLIAGLAVWSRLFHPWTFGTVGAALAVAVFLALLAWWTPLWRSVPYILFAAIVGFVGGSGYGIWLQTTLRTRHYGGP